MNSIPHDHRPAVEMLPAGWIAPSSGVRFPVLGMILLSTWAGAAGANVAPTPHAVASTVHGFNFAYQPEGGRLAAPTQIFDDGHRTYMQFNALDHVPELWSDDGKGRGDARRLTFHLESPYVVVDQVLPRLRLTLDGQNTILINQGWAARSSVHATAPRSGQARIWLDRTPFGPEQLPGPVAATRETVPSREPLPTVSRRLAQQSVRHAGSAPGPRSLPAAVEGGEDAATDPPQSPDSNPAETAAVALPASLTAVLAREPRATTPAGEGAAEPRIEDLRARAQSMVAQAHEAGDLALEQRLRRIFSDLALFPEDGPGSDEDRRRQHPPRYALAETRPRSDTPVLDESDAQSPRTPAHPSASAATEGPRVAAAAADARPAVPAGTGRASAAAPAALAAAGGAAARSPELIFEVRDNQRLSQALGQFLETQGWRLEWESQSDFLVRRGYVVRAPDLRQVLLQALGGYRLSAVMYSGNLVVAVSGGEP